MPIFFFIVILVLLIVGHEFGHFVFAKLARMRVLEFGVGFPPKVWGRKIGETLYSVNALPFGGFVRIFGEDPEEDFKDPRAFSKRPPVSQAAVIVAGPLMNVLLAYFFALAALLYGVPQVIDSGAGMHTSDERVIIGNVLEQSPAQIAGIMRGDVVISVTDSRGAIPIKTPQELAARLSEATSAVSLSILRDGKEISVSVTPVQGIAADDPERKAIGIGTALIGTVSYPLLEALEKAFFDTAERGIDVLLGLSVLVSGALTFSSDLSNIAGPVGIAGLASEAAVLGIGSFLSLIAVISMNLAIINLLPFPALDGGRLAVLAIEAIVRRKIPHSYANAANYVGFVLLILLMLVVTVHDISRLVT